MKKTVFTLIFSLCAVLVTLAFSVQADSALQLSVAESGGDYKTVERALAAVEELAKKGELNEKGVRLVLSGTHTATACEGVLFGQKTIFLPDGKKLPVTLTGGTLLLPEGDVACANDYTFTELTLPLDDTATRLFAGSGNVTLEKLVLDANSTPEYKSAFYGDTFTAKVFEGWSEQNLALSLENGLFVSSMTLGEGFVYENPTGYPYAAVGASEDFSALIGGITLSASGTCPKLIVDGAKLHNTMARTGANPAGNSVLYIKKGSVNRLYAAGHAQQKTVVGDVTVCVEGGTFKSFVRLLSEVTLKGDLRVSLKNMDLTANDEATDGRMIQMLFHSGAIHGDLSVEMENVKADQYYGGFSSSGVTLTGDAVTTAKNCEFKKFFYGGLGKSVIYGNVENTLENVTTDHFNGAGDCTLLGKQDDYTGKKDSVGNITNRLKNVTFTETAASASIHLGNVNGTQSGSIFNTLEGVFVPKNHTVYCGNRGGSAKSVVNTVKDSTFSSTFCGGGSGGTVTDLANTISDSTFHNYLYLAGSGNTVKGQIENRLKNCDVTKYYTFGGVNGGKVLNSHLEYGVKNYVEGGSFHGFWGGSASSSATHRGNLYTEISSGDFYGFDSSRPNSFSGGCRNTRHEGNAVSLIRGGTFHEYVVGGSIPNSEAYKNDHVGSATLTLAGGTFKNSIYPNCLWGSYPEVVLNLDNTYALEPFSFALAVECDTFVAGSSDPTPLSFPLTCKNLIARGSGPLRLYSKALCESFVAEENAPSPELYGELTCTTLGVGDKPLILGAKSRIKTQRVVGGAVTLHQNEAWLKQTYFTAPQDTKITLSQSESALGEGRVKNGVAEGFSTAFAGVSILFADQVSLRFAFDKDWAEADRDGFSFTAKCGDRPITEEVKFSDLILKDGYYTVVSAPLNAAELGKAISCSGTLVSEFSFTIPELAEAGLKIYDKEGNFKPLGELLKAFANFSVAADNYKNGKSTPLPYEITPSETDFVAANGLAPLTGDPAVTLTDKQLVLDEGMRLRYYFRSEEMRSTDSKGAVVNALHYFHNCADVTKNATKKWISAGFQKGYYEITLDLPIFPSESDQAIRLTVSDKENLHLALPDTSSPYTSYVHADYVDRLDAVAKTLSQTAGSEELGSALLCYLQAGAAYYKTQPDLSSFVYPKAFSAGYAREDISPYGIVLDLSSSKTSDVVLDPLYASCLALWDGEELALYFSLDVRQSPDYLTRNAKALLAEEFEIDPDKIFFNATHNHSSPNTTSPSRADVSRWYHEIFFPKVVQAAKKAVLDLAPSSLYTGTASSDPGTNYVRRYLRKDGSYTGIHNIVPTTNIVGYETEADKELRTLRFERDGKKDILFVNWQGHAAHAAAYDYAATADFVGFLRDGVEAHSDVHFIYCNGASGNLNFTPKLGEKYFTSPYFQGVGKSLAGTVKKAMEAEKPIRSGKLQVTKISHLGIIRHDDGAIIQKANECYTAWQEYKKEKGKDPSMSWFQTNFGFQSRYDVSHIRSRADMGESEILPVWAFSFGDVGMAFAPYEMFDSNGMQIRAASPFAVTMIGGYTNDTRGYIPSSFAAPHNGYEVYTSRYVFTTGDEVAAKLGNALNQMHR